MGGGRERKEKTGKERGRANRRKRRTQIKAVDA